MVGNAAEAKHSVLYALLANMVYARGYRAAIAGISDVSLDADTGTIFVSGAVTTFYQKQIVLAAGLDLAHTFSLRIDVTEVSVR
jgi:hypothetical protein